MEFYVKQAYTCNTIKFKIYDDEIVNIDYQKLYNKIIFEWRIKFHINFYNFDIIPCGHGEEYTPINVINFNILHNMENNNVLSLYIKEKHETNANLPNITNLDSDVILYECPICYIDRILFKMCVNGHTICMECIDNIRHYDMNCPICRSELLNNIS